jgi:hypothetical protein
MPAQQSNYERDRQQQRTASRRGKERNHLFRKQRGNVENIISVNREATRLSQTIQDFDQNKDNMQEKVAADRTFWWCNVIFLAAVAAYVTGEFFAQGDVAEWLAYQIGPLFLGGHEHPAETPVWLRRTAGGGFVVLMLAATLLVKFVTTWFIKHFTDLRTRVQAGDDLSHWRLTAGIWINYVARIGYLAAVATFYVWLYGFAQDRAAIAAASVAEQKAIESTNSPITFSDGRIQTNAPANESNTSKPAEGPRIGGKLAYATGVVYAVIVLLHALVLILPTDGLGKELPLAHFKRGALQRKLESLHDEQDRIARTILHRIYSVNGEERQELIRITTPVASLVNRGWGGPVMEVPGQSPSDTSPDNPGDASAGTIAGSQPNPPQPGAPAAQIPPEAAENTAEPDDVYAAIFGSASPQPTT